MLILTRKPCESIFIGDDIKVTVLGYSGSQVRIGIIAPDDVVILREEVKYRDELPADNTEKKLNSLVSHYAERKTV